MTSNKFFINKLFIGIFFFSMAICTTMGIARNALAVNANLSLQLQNTNLPDAIRFIAKLLNINVIISPAVHGVAVMNLNNATPQDAFNTLLISHGLARSRIGNVWLIASQNELIKLKQDELKWQDLNEELSPLRTEIWQVQYAKALDISHLLQDEQASLLSKKGRVRVDARTNTICVQDVEQRLQSMRSLLRHLDVPVQQISIEARLVSVDSDFERELGIQFAVKLPAAENEGSQKNTIFREKGSYSLAVAKLADGSLLDMKLAAMENQGHAEIISKPSLFTANQQPASIEAGEDLPYQEVSESGGTAVVFKKAVLGLKVVPQVLPGNKVLLQLQINQDRPSNKMVQGMPTISTRQMLTNVLVKNGQTIVLGGIYEANNEKGELGIPFLSRIPWVGMLFKQQNIRHNKRELLIFVTPKIVNS